MSDYDAGQGLKGAGGGALAGFAVGGPMGALVGGGLGLLGGFGNGESEAEQAQRQMMMQEYAMMGKRQAPQLGSAQNSAYSGFRQNQTGLVNRLEAMANGQGPSLARQMFEQATDRNMRAQQSMAASGRGGPMAQLTAANNMGMLGAQAAQGGAIARTNEQMQAIGQLGNVIGQGRAADEGTNQFNANQNNQFQIQNLNARLQAMGMNDQMRMSILQQLGSQNQAQAQRPGLGDQIMAGGAGMYAAKMSQKAGMPGGNVGMMARGSTMNPYAAPGKGSTMTPNWSQPAPFNYNHSNLGQ
jgi:hypothetical protein